MNMAEVIMNPVRQRIHSKNLQSIQKIVQDCHGCIERME